MINNYAERRGYLKSFGVVVALIASSRRSIADIADSGALVNSFTASPSPIHYYLGVIHRVYIA